MKSHIPAPAAAHVVVIGRGRLGRAFARALRAAGLCVTGPLGRDETAPRADIGLLCVTDSEIPSAAAAIADRVRLIGHTSGATPIDDVDFGLHPVQTFTGDEHPDVFVDLACAVAAHRPAGRDAAALLVGAVGGRAFDIADEDRAAYHAACCIASNFLVTLEEAAAGAASAAGIPTASARDMLAPLIRRTIDNWVELGAGALTGPITRGDAATVARQRAALSDVPGALELFDAMHASTSRMIEEEA
ncbi:DUF2520 domain-containing protein [Microbacterium halophytorum]|uniref:DUF2520 domain-containing protein n=1 Tax=Microbacterium halophytorum TaxID=2067568 RepID=UPI000CFC56FF|nr:DUF2520 domain-containing protein [Microbacterium halophytorum]